MKAKSEACPSSVILFTIRLFSRFCSRWDLGITKLKLMNYQTEHQTMGREERTELITERLSLRVVLIFVVIHSPCKHALRKELAMKRSVDDLELSDGQRRKSARITHIGFLSSPWSGFRQLKHRVQKR